MISRKLIKWLRCDSEVVMNTLVQVLVILERSSAVNKRTYTENASNNRQLKKKSMQVNEGKNLKKKKHETYASSSSNNNKKSIYFKPLRVNLWKLVSATGYRKIYICLIIITFFSSELHVYCYCVYILQFRTARNQFWTVRYKLRMFYNPVERFSAIDLMLQPWEAVQDPEKPTWSTDTWREERRTCGGKLELIFWLGCLEFIHKM